MRAFLLQNLSVSEGSARWKPNLKVLDASMVDITGWPATPAGATYGGPTLFVRGGVSDYVQSSHEATIKALFPKMEMQTVADAGHWLHAEQPKKFFEVVDTFLDFTFR